mmetsp:Transcript_28621/g.47343  ORF Transcript_28621/g.47343 Transcript_28621/m.47343 type:complete len:275 (+) Transcript_28621:417-1241(+)
MRAGTPKRALHELREIDPECRLSLKQVQNYFQRNRARLLSAFVDGLDTVGATNRFCEANPLTATSPRDKLVVAPGWRVSESEILVGLTTRGLLLEARRSLLESGLAPFLSCDNTYNLTRHGYVFQVYGFILPCGKFLCVMIVCATSEEQVIQLDGMKSMCDSWGIVHGEDFPVPVGAVADAALNIRNALRELWPGIIIGVCFFHCKKALHTNKGKFVSDENYKKFCADVDLLHTVTKPEIFVVGLELLLRRWRSDFSLLVLQPWSLLSPALTQL